MKEKICDECKKNEVMHYISYPLRGIKLNLCCECHVIRGGIPADWHSLCMSTYREIKKTAVNDITIKNDSK